MITSYFGYRDTDVGSSDHKGLDIAGSSGQDIYAADGGEVIYADWLEGYGYLVKILHDNGDVTYYGHCSELLVYEGEKVGRGELIAYMGCTGVASGDHLHFEIRRDDTPIDPLEELPAI
ncbi:MAG: M23 family metallopeptidase [Firmicutes bacterium]|nr:M23 family metallopeptidase [Bacillota bacterium]